MADILYTYKNSVYLNLTNRCTCSCIFCIRSEADALGSAKNLWHGEIVTGGKTVFSSGELPLDAPDFIPARLRVIAATANNNDGMKITVKPPAVTAAPAAR